MNIAVHLPAEFQNAVEPVTDALIEHFRQQDADVAIVHRAEAWSFWREVIAGLRASEGDDLDLDTALASYARALTEHDQFDLLVMPSLVFREAEASGRYARWDGVRRRIHFYDRSAVKGAELDHSEWESRVTALSLHVVVFTRDGTEQFEGFGGLDTVHDLVVSRGTVGDRPTLRLRRDVLDDPEFIREGVSEAFDRFELQAFRNESARHLAQRETSEAAAAAPDPGSVPASPQN
jgi:hypothetical protein